jgi:hypothetical protein
MMAPKYTTQLQAGLGLGPETLKLLTIWKPGMAGLDLLNAVLTSCEFLTVRVSRCLAATNDRSGEAGRTPIADRLAHGCSFSTARSPAAPFRASLKVKSDRRQPWKKGFPSSFAC